MSAGAAVTGCASCNPGRTAHVKWEQERAQENECDAERELAQSAADTGVDMSRWWGGWFERSDEWRDEIGHCH